MPYKNKKDAIAWGYRYRKRNKDRIKIKNKRNYSKYTIEQKILLRARDRATLKTLDYDLKLRDLKAPKVCPILKIKLRLNGRTGSKDTSPSLDRIDNSKGYTKTNVQIISNKANTMKGNATPKELLLFADWIYKMFGTK